MHLTVDGSIISALFVLALALWSSGPYVVDLFKGARTVLGIVGLAMLALAVFVVVMAAFR